MKVTDLRLGNIISDENNNTCIVYSVNNDCVIAKYLNVGSALGGIEAFKPIPLTEEWLFKFGFYKFSNQFVLKGTLNITRWSGDNMKSVYLEFGNKVVEIYCEYVHQLQNIFFALTGEELTIKTNKK